MTTHTTVQSWKALAVAGVILAGTCYVLFQDVLEGARFTTGHVLTALALLIATVAGHQIVPTFKAGRYMLTLSMVALAAGAILYIGIMSGARNAESISIKAERIEGANAQRADVLAERARAKDMLDAARAAIAKECASGPGSRCKGRQATAEVYTAAIAGHDARLAALGSPQTANAGYKAAAEGIVLLPWFRDARVADVERMLVVLLPWLAVLLAELSVPAFLSLALGHQTVPTLADTRQSSFAAGNAREARDTLAGKGPEGDPSGPGGKRRKAPARLPATVAAKSLPANVVPITSKGSPSLSGKHPVIAALEAAGRPLTNVQLAEAMKVCGGESTKRRREVAHLLDEQVVGKFVLVGLREWREAVA